MARPSPRAVVRLREKIDTSVTRARRSRIRKVPTMAKTPTPRGRSADTTDPKTRISKHQGDGKRDRLGRQQVGLDGFVDLGEERAFAADRYVETLKLAAVLVGQLTRVFEQLGLGPVHRGEDQGAGPIDAPQRCRRAEGPIGVDRGHMLFGLEGGTEGDPGGCRGIVVDRTRGGGDDDDVGRSDAELVGQDLGGDDRFGRRIVKATVGQAGGNSSADALRPRSSLPPPGRVPGPAS